METNIGKTQVKDAQAVAEMYREGRAFLHASGVDQWQDGYPSLSDVLQDIQDGVSYLLTVGEIPAASMAVVEKEPDYDDIYGGEWLTGKCKNYFAVHRVCVADAFKRRGLTSVLYDFAARLALSSGRDSLRADTHRDNAAMRSALLKNGFSECGIIYPAYGGERIAYEKIIEEKEYGERTK